MNGSGTSDEGGWKSDSRPPTPSAVVSEIERIRLQRERRRTSHEQARRQRQRELLELEAEAEAMEQAMRAVKHRTSSSGGMRSKSQPRSRGERGHHRSSSRDSRGGGGGDSSSATRPAARDGRAEIEFRRMIKEFRDGGGVLERPGSAASLSRGPSPSPLSRQPSTSSVSSNRSASNLNVYVRKRPLSSEDRLRMFDVVSVTDERTVVVHEPKSKVDLTLAVETHVFRCDAVFDETATNEAVYKVRVVACAVVVGWVSTGDVTTYSQFRLCQFRWRRPCLGLLPLAAQTVVREHIDALVEGCYLTCFAYGQTGSGKTFTMDSVITHTVRDLFAMLFRTGRSAGVTVGVSYYEVYMSKARGMCEGRGEGARGNRDGAAGVLSSVKSSARLRHRRLCRQVFDLLDSRKELVLREDQHGNVNVVGLRECAAAMPSDVLGLVSSGHACRRTGSTQVVSR